MSAAVGIELVGVRKAFGATTVFDGLDLAFSAGTVTAVMGASGVGKTTLLNLIAGLTPFEGAIRTDGRPVLPRVGYVFQEPRLVPHMTVLENLRYVGIAPDAARDLLAELELADKADARPAALSGGMAQRVGMARAWGVDSDVLLMDEPFRALDLGLRARLVALFGRMLAARPRTVVYVTHDPDEAIAVADRIVLLGHGTATPLAVTEPPHFDLARTDGPLRAALVAALTRD